MKSLLKKRDGNTSRQRKVEISKTEAQELKIKFRVMRNKKLKIETAEALEVKLSNLT